MLPIIVKPTLACQIGNMKAENEFVLTRREFLGASAAVPVFLIYGTAQAATGELAPTPACGDKDDVTPAQTPGPFFKPRSLERKSLLEPGIQGTKIILEGRVRSTRCKPIEKALVDFWQADASGEYDNSGYRLDRKSVG